ncbi:hypothetical protein [Thalassotalea ganghwensis]
MLKKLFNKRYLLTLILSVFIGLAFFTQRQIIACHTVTLSGYSEIAPNILISPSINDADTIVRTIKSAKERIEQTFGPVTANSRVVIVNNAEQAASLWSNQTGSTIYSPFGSCVVLGPKGQNTDVAAHELFHAEVFHRAGWFTHFTQVPIWFNEGIALLVDHRKPFKQENIDISEQDIVTVKQAFSSQAFFNTNNIVKRYQSARMATADINPATFYQNLERLAHGEQFQDVFKSL